MNVEKDHEHSPGRSELKNRLRMSAIGPWNMLLRSFTMITRQVQRRRRERMSIIRPITQSGQNPATSINRNGPANNTIHKIHRPIYMKTIVV